MREFKSAPIGANTFAVRFDSYERGEAKGVVEGLAINGSLEFPSIPSLILTLDEIMDRGEEMRLQKPSPNSFSPTMEIDVLFRHNNSWQGRVRWYPDKQEFTFHSVLELLMIIETMMRA